MENMEESLHLLHSLQRLDLIMFLVLLSGLLLSCFVKYSIYGKLPFVPKFLAIGAFDS